MNNRYIYILAYKISIAIIKKYTFYTNNHFISNERIVSVDPK